MARKKKNIRVTKKEINRIKEKRKKWRKQKKKIIRPGPWSEVETKVKIKADLKRTQSIAPTLGEYCGIYRSTDGWNEKGTYPIVFNITARNMTKLAKKHTLDELIAACEKALNEIKDESGKKLYGDLIILEILSDQSKNPKRQFISCVGKTSKKRIAGFMAIRQNKLQVLE